MLTVKIPYIDVKVQNFKNSFTLSYIYFTLIPQRRQPDVIDSILQLEKLRQTEIIVNKQEGTIISLTETTDQLSSDNVDIKTKFGDYVPMEEYTEFKNGVETTQTDTYTKTEIKQILKGTFYDTNNNQVVSEIVHTSSATFDANGMTYEKKDNNNNYLTSTTINETGMNVKNSSGNSLLFAGYVERSNPDYGSRFEGQTMVATDNIMVNHYLLVGSHSRFEDYESGTGCFYV